jgi:hypothetical protein
LTQGFLFERWCKIKDSGDSYCQIQEVNIADRIAHHTGVMCTSILPDVSYGGIEVNGQVVDLVWANNAEV